ncbi:MAG: DUF4397 domain-containing protein [Chitinophagales bacterium]|nr:DUF4397 domain-containing protein [Chitinophagales bacterium]
MNVKTLLVFSLLWLSLSSKAQVTRVQFINNCPELALPTIDIYVNGSLSVNDLFFRSSQAYVDLPAGTALDIGVAESTSLTVADTFYNMNITLNQTNVYVMVIDGVKSTTGYSPYKKLSMHVYNMGQEGATAGKTDLLFLNGCTDAPQMDIRTGLDILANDLGYGDFSNGYTSLSATGYYNFRITNTVGNKTTHNYEADFPTLSTSGLGVVVIGSGFMNPAANSNGEPFGLWLSLPTGGPLVELPFTTTAEKLARIQVIHNSADTGVGKLDFYVNNQKAIDTLDFRHATAYMDAYAGLAMNVGIAKAGSGNQFFNTNITLDSGKTYAAVLNGIESDTNYLPKPALTIDLNNNAREEATVATSTDVLYMHGSTDAPAIDIRKADNSSLFADLNYGDFSASYGTIAQGGVPVIKIDTGSGNVLMEKYEIKITDWNLTGKSVTILFSGFATPDSNSGGPALSMWAALPEGGAMKELPVYTTVDNAAAKAKHIKLFPNPAHNVISFETTTATNNILVTDVTGKVVIRLDNYSKTGIDISGLASGTYLLLMQDEEGTINYSEFIKQ